MEKLSHFLVLIFLITLSGCKNPLDEKSVGASSVEDAFNALLQKPGSFSFTNYDLQSAQVILRWTDSERAESYQVKYGTASGNYTMTASCTSSPCTITGLSGGTLYYFTVIGRNVKGTTSVSSELSLMPGSLANFSFNIPFDVGTGSSYIFSDSSVSEMSGGLIKLTSLDQTDDDGTMGGFGGGSLSGVQYDAVNSVLRLNTTTNTSELDSSWTPKWSHLVGYWKMSGSGLVSSSNFNTDIGLSGCKANGPSSASYQTGKVGQGIGLTNSAWIGCAGAPIANIANDLTIMGWLSYSGGTIVNYQSFMHLINYGVQGWMIQRNQGDNFFYIRVDTSAQTNAICAVGSNDRGVFDGEWHHYAITLSSGTIKTYIDGRLSSTCSYSHGSGFASNATSLGIFGLTTDTTTYHDELAFFSTVLSATDIKTIYDRQAAKYSGQFISRMIDGLSAKSWTSLKTLTSIPFFKELIAGQESNSASTGYPNINSNLSSNLWGLWHLNEASGTTFADSSGANRHLTLSGSYSLGSPGLFDNGASFTTLGGQALRSPVTFNPTQSYSISAWLRMDGRDVSAANRTAITFQGTQYPSIYISMHGTTKKMRFIICAVDASPCSNVSADATSVVPSKRWFHLLAIYDSVEQKYKIYINGILEGVAINSLTAFSPSNFAIGTTMWAGGANADKWPGMIDEVAVWTRSLSDVEIKELYRRGANRVKFHVRTCSTSNCSEAGKDVSNNFGWSGPDGTVNTYYSELTNSTLGNLNAALSASSNQYVQYKAILESDDTNSLCSYGNCSPQIKSVTLGPDHYPMTNAYVTNKVVISTLFQTLNSFSVAKGSNGCTGDRYSISNDGTHFWYFNGSTWVISDGSYAQSSTTAQVNSNISSLVAAMGAGTLQVRTYLNSDGTTACEVDNILVQGTRY